MALVGAELSKTDTFYESHSMKIEKYFFIRYEYFSEKIDFRMEQRCRTIEGVDG
jgi:hypothetical protein